MSPSEYQELTSFFVEQLGRHQATTHAFVLEQLDLQRQETRAFVGVSVESLRHEIRLVAGGVLTNRRLIEEIGARIEENGARIEENSARIEGFTQRMAGVETTVSARFADHEERLRVLE